MASGWSRDGAVQDQIDASVKDAIKLAKSQLPQGNSLTHCEACDDPIPDARRAAIPGVRLCVECQAEADEEQNKRSSFLTDAAVKTVSYVDFFYFRTGAAMKKQSFFIIVLITMMALMQNLQAEDSSANGHAELIPVCDMNDPTYKKTGGRNLCKRECRESEIGPSGKLCETKEDPGSGEKFCDCGV